MKKTLEQIKQEIIEASKITQLYKDMNARFGKFVIHKGSEQPEILFIGEAGGKDEDKCGLPFVGRSGKLLDNWIKHCKLENTATINAVPIMPQNAKGGIRKPTDSEITYFRPYIQKLIKKLNPTYIILLGRSAEKAYFAGTCLLQNMEWHNKIGLIYHPSYFMRNGRTGEDDFKKLIGKMK